MAIILPANTLSGGYEVANSCRFNDGDSASMTKSVSGTSQTTAGTISFWFKRGALSTDQRVWINYVDANNYGAIKLQSDNKIEVVVVDGGSVTAKLVTNRLFRDCSAWYHCCVALNSSDGTAGNRMRLYINGTEETSFATDTNPSSGVTMEHFTDGTNKIGQMNSDQYFDGYIAEFVMIHGSQLTPSSFGEFDEDSPTIWKPKDVSGLSFGSKDYYLDFEDSGDLGDDESGQGNDFTESNLAAADQTTDTPTNNFATLNPLGFAGTIPTFSQGNLNAVVGSGATLYSVSTIGVSSGKWYVEGELEAADTSDSLYYVDHGFHDRANTLGQSMYASSGRLFWLSSWDGKINYRTGGSTTAGLVTGLATLTPGDFFQLYLDMDNELMYWGKNGSLLNSTGVSFNGKESLTGEYFFAFGDQYTSGNHEYAVNFGQGSIDGAAVTAHNDANGYGNFKYNPSVTTDEGDKDFLALCTKNLAEYGG